MSLWTDGDSRLQDLLARREKTDRVTDLVNLDRVRGLLRTVYWRRRFLAARDEKRRTLNVFADGIPAIVLDPTPVSPPDEEMNQYDDSMRETTPSPSRSRQFSLSPSPEVRTIPLHSPEMSFASINRHSPSLSVSSQPRQSLPRRVSNSSMLSSDDAHYRRSVVTIAQTAANNLLTMACAETRSTISSRVQRKHIWMPWRRLHGEVSGVVSPACVTN